MRLCQGASRRVSCRSQRLIAKKDGKGRVAAVEVMLNSPLISDLIFKGEVGEIKETMKKSRELGMQTFDQSLFELYEAGKISYEDALRNADSLNDLRLQIKLYGKESKDRDLTSGIGHLDIVCPAPHTAGRYLDRPQVELLRPVIAPRISGALLLCHRLCRWRCPQRIPTHVRPQSPAARSDPLP